MLNYYSAKTFIENLKREVSIIQYLSKFINYNDGNNMSKFFQADSKPKNFNINKGNVKILNQDSDWSIEYPNSMEGHIEVKQKGETVEVNLNKDFPNELPVKLNINSLDHCNIYLKNGMIDLSHTCPKTYAKVDNGRLSAKLSKDEFCTVKANVGTGVLSNHSNLNTPHYSENNYHNFGSGISSIYQDYNLNSKVELSGNGTKEATFEVKVGIMELN